MAITFRKFFESKNILITESNVDEIYQKHYKDVIDREIFDKIVKMFKQNYQVRWTIAAYRELTNEAEKKRFIKEDMPKLIDLFKTYDYLKQKNVPAAKNLNLYAIKSIPDLNRIIVEITGEDETSDDKKEESSDSLQRTRERNVGKDGSFPKLEKLYENGTYIVVRPMDEKSLNAVSRKCGWCTDAEKEDRYYGDNYFPKKNKRGNDNRLYLIENKNKWEDRYLVHLIGPDHQIMNRWNEDQSDNLQNLNPELLDALFHLGDIDEVTEEILTDPKAAATFYILMELLGK